ncbi:MAG: hypothetical protein WA191_20750 [Telluria sp.]
MIVLDPIPVTDAILISTNVPETDYPAFDPNGVYAAGDRVITVATDVHDIYQQLLGTASTVTLTIAAPCVVSKVAHGYPANQPVKLTTTGALPTGLVAGTTYYVKSPTADAFNLSAAPGGAAINTTGVQAGVHTLTANAIGQTPATSPTYWTLVGVTNARKMFDELNNTQTENAESIVISLTPSQIAGGLYLGGVVADDIVVTVTDPVDGVIYDRTESLIQSTSGSSFFNWCFGRIRRKNFFLALDLPMYYESTVQVSILKPGGIAKCGMCALGPLTELGFTTYGLGVEDKDYSSTRFDVDGSSETTVRGYAKKMSIDVLINNDVIDYVIDILRTFRQRNVLYIGATQFGHSVIFGKYTSFKNVIPDFPTSRMALGVDGVI